MCVYLFVFDRFPSKYACTLSQISTPQAKDHLFSPQSTDYSEICPYYSTLISNRRVTKSDHWQDVRLVTLDIKNSDIK